MVIIAQKEIIKMKIRKIKQLFCKHDYYLNNEYLDSIPLNGPTSKCICKHILIYKCNKCGKEYRTEY